ncbi:MAG: hypothetical protein O3A00_13960 [Planctomycetota bacterium]|nr:hypothetical protein [Planctomycetota bacterium]
MKAANGVWRVFQRRERVSESRNHECVECESWASELRIANASLARCRRVQDRVQGKGRLADAGSIRRHLRTQRLWSIHERVRDGVRGWRQADLKSMS